MAISQNARFSGEALVDGEFDHPAGASIARLVKDGLAERGWKVSDIDNWRDGGWRVTCCSPTSKLELIVAKDELEADWFLQVAPSYVPGIVGRLMRKHASAQPEAILALAKDTYLVLSENGRFKNFKWCWDDNPAEGNSTPQPVPEG